MSIVGVTGIRPSPGGLHLGHYIGNISPVISGTDQNQDIYFILGDLHLLSGTDGLFSVKNELNSSVFDMMADAIACGVDPNRIAFCLQSQLSTNLMPMFLLLGSLVNLPRIQRLPAIKALLSNDLSKISLSALNFPLVEVVDLLAFRANIAYANIDNKPFIELTNELVRRFNRHFGYFFPELCLVNGIIPLLVGIDGNKMSKTKGNCIFIRDETLTVNKKVMKMFTDPSRIRADISGNTDTNPVFIYHRAFNPNKPEINDIEVLYRSGKIGDVAVKEKLFVVLESIISPIRERARYIRSNESELKDILHTGISKSERQIQATMSSFLEITGFSQRENKG